MIQPVILLVVYKKLWPCNFQIQGRFTGSPASAAKRASFVGTIIIHRSIDIYQWGTLWWTNILQWKITMFNGKIHYFYAHFQ